MSTRKRLFLLLAALLGGISLLVVASTGSIFLIRREIANFSADTSPLKIQLSQLQQGLQRIDRSFSRISASATSSDLRGVEAELDRTITEVQSASKELGVSGNIPEQLRQLAHQRIEGRRRVADAYRSVIAELESAAEPIGKLSPAMARLQQSNLAALVSSRQSSLEANAAIQALLVERTRIEQLRAALFEPRQRDKIGEFLDSMATQELPDKALALKVKSFLAVFTGATTSGLPADNLASPMDDLSREIGAEIDRLKLGLGKSNTALSQSTETLARAAAISIAVAETILHLRSIEALGERLLSASDAASLDRMTAELTQHNEEANHGFSSIIEGLYRLDRPLAGSEVMAAQKSLTRVRDLLIGTAGVASFIREGLKQQSQEELLLEGAIRSSGQMAIAGSSQARNANGARQQAMARSQEFSTRIFFLAGFVLLVAFALVFVDGRRIGKEILLSEANRLKSAKQIRLLMERVRTGAHTLRVTSRSLIHASERVTRNVESIAAGASQIETSIRGVAAQASEASQAGSGAASLVESASTAVVGLHQASAEISKVSSMIRSIAFETNLLALNAAIEAAHAGKFGAGFGVVASEVKKLAEAAGASTAEIDARIKTMTDQVEMVTSAMAGVTSIIAKIREMQDSIAAEVQRHTTTGKLAGSAAATAGIQDIALQLSGLAEDLEALCQSR